MDYVYKTWSAALDITSVCPNACVYCTRYTRHLRGDQRAHMPLEKIEAAIIAYKDYPSNVFIIGGEPLLHPDLKQINKLLREHLPQQKLSFFTSGLPNMRYDTEKKTPNPQSKYSWKPEYAWSKWPEVNSDMTDTYGTIRLNPHDANQQEICRHHPLTLAVNEIVADEAVMWKLINNCWVQRLWSPTVNIHGAYFCEIGAALDRILYDGANAWEVTPHWWKRKPHEFQEQVAKLCIHCGMCVPMERQTLEDDSELFSPKLLELFRKKGMKRLDAKVQVVDRKLSLKELADHAHKWYPANYRDDLVDDDSVPFHVRGLLVPLNVDLTQENVFPIDTDESYARSLERAKTLPILTEPYLLPLTRYFIYQDIAFDPLTEQYPFVFKDNPDGQKLYHRGMMLYLRPLLDDEQFAKLPKEGCSFEELINLPDTFEQVFEAYKVTLLQQKLQALKGKKVYLWGHGHVYQQYKKLLQEITPVAFLNDTPQRPETFEGLPVIHPQELQTGTKEELPILVFVRRSYLPGITHSLERKYPKLLENPPLWFVL